MLARFTSQKTTQKVVLARATSETVKNRFRFSWKDKVRFGPGRNLFDTP